MSFTIRLLLYIYKYTRITQITKYHIDFIWYYTLYNTYYLLLIFFTKLTIFTISVKIVQYNLYTSSPYSNRPFSVERVVGGLSYEGANITAARAFKASFAIESKMAMDKSSGEDVTKFLTWFECFVLMIA